LAADPNLGRFIGHMEEHKILAIWATCHDYIILFMREIMIVKLKLHLIGIWGTCWPDSGIYESLRPSPTWSPELVVYINVPVLKKEYIYRGLNIECY
jgi:hypothetical protein